MPGVAERGYADEQGVRALLEKLRRHGLGVYRVAPPTPENYLLGRPGGDEEVDNLCRTLEALGKAGVPFMSMPLHLDNPGLSRRRAGRPSRWLHHARLRYGGDAGKTWRPSRRS